MKIPPQAKKVFSGEIFDVYQWPQKMFDGSTATFEMLRRVAAVNIIAVVEKKIILLQQEQPAREMYPSLPGGKIDMGEAPEAAARRELLEETGYTTQNISLFGYYNENNKIDFDDYIFIAKDCRQVAKQNLDAGEKITVRLASFDELLQAARDPLFAIPQTFRLELIEALLDPNKKTELRKKLGL